MKLYAATPVRRTLQVLGDLLFIAWLVAWVLMGNVVHDATMELAGPGRQTAQVGTSLSQDFKDAGGVVDDIPLVGDQARAPFDKAADSADGLADAGRGMVHAVERLAFWLRLSVTLIPILAVAVFFLPLRWRFVRRATAGQRFIDAAPDLDLFALRALANQPMHVLARVHDDPAGAWRQRDPAVTRRLAELELRSDGLRPPRVDASRA
jgi:hypothetical protein